MGTLLLKQDIEAADNLMSNLIEKIMICREEYHKSIQYIRIISVLSEYGYILDDYSHLRRAEKAKLYFNNGGAKAIYKEQQRAKKIADWTYSNMRWTNIRSWAAIILSALAIGFEIVKLFIL